MGYSFSLRNILRVAAFLLILFVSFYSLAAGQTVPPPPPTGTGEGGVGGTGGGQTIGLEDPLKAGDIATLLDRIATFLLVISVPIAAIMVVVGGFQIMVYGSNPEKVKTGRNTILYAAIGFAIVLLAKGVTVVIKEVLSAGAGGGASPPTAPPTAGTPPPTEERSEREQELTK